MASWLVRSSPDRAVQVQALAGDFTLTAPLSTQVYKWVLAHLLAHLMLEVTLRWTPGGSSNIPSRLMLQKPG